MSLSRGVMEKAFAETLKTLPQRPEDAAMIALGRRLARLIDLARGENADDPAAGRDGSESLIVLKLSGEFRQVLSELGASPKARAGMFGKAPAAAPDKPKSDFEIQRDELAAMRAKREQNG